MCECFIQMSDNRRRGRRCAQQEQQAPQDEEPQLPPPPPPMKIEQMFLMQTQAFQAIGETLAAMQQVQQQPQPQLQVQMPRHKRAEFMRGHPPVFAHSTNPMDTDDWLRQWSGSCTPPNATIERRFCMVPVC
jgi:hypothetical protein